MDTLFLIAFFASVFILTLIFSAVVDWALYRVFGIRIYPRRFFHMEKDTWSKW